MLSPHFAERSSKMDKHDERKLEILKKLAQQYKSMRKTLDKMYSEIILYAPEIQGSVVSEIMDDIYDHLKDAQIDCEDCIEFMTHEKVKNSAREEERKSDEEFFTKLIATWGYKGLGD